MGKFCHVAHWNSDQSIDTRACDFRPAQREALVYLGSHMGTIGLRPDNTGRASMVTDMRIHPIYCFSISITSTGAVVALFLALTAVQFVVSQSMPASSYVTAMGELIIFSYVILIFDGMETILVYNLSKSCERRKRCAPAQGLGFWKI